MITKQKRKIIKIDEEKCDGCGNCVVSCAEGAIKIIDGKARLISEKYCDGLGACLGECPRGAITLEEKQAEEFDEKAVKIHLEKKKRGKTKKPSHPQFSGCPSSRIMEFARPKIEDNGKKDRETTPSMLTQWPIKIALVPPGAPFLENADLLLAADCAPFAFAGFHRDFIKDKAVIIGCPKLDDPEFYKEKITMLLKSSNIKSLTVVHMEVPCCHALYYIAKQAIEDSGKDIPLKKWVIGIRGDKREEESNPIKRGACNHDH
ncbi:MAG TPA: 4Fe-4S binding protein [Nitrospinota bacterium]|nr:4Fe-4S binding protein [Nitrospinota bacterium]